MFYYCDVCAVCLTNVTLFVYKTASVANMILLKLVGNEGRGHKREGAKNATPIVVLATRTSKRIKEKKDWKSLASVSAGAVNSKRKRTSAVQKQCRSRRSQSMCRAVFLVD